MRVFVVDSDINYEPAKYTVTEIYPRDFPFTTGLARLSSDFILRYFNPSGGQPDEPFSNRQEWIEFFRPADLLRLGFLLRTPSLTEIFKYITPRHQPEIIRPCKVAAAAVSR